MGNASIAISYRIASSSIELDSLTAITMTKLQRRERKRESRRSQGERAGGADNASLHRTSFFSAPSSPSSPPASASSQIVSLLSHMRPMSHLERCFQSLNTHDPEQQRLPEAAAATDVTASLPEEIPAKLRINLPAELSAESQAKIADIPSEPPAEPPAEPIPKKPALLLASPSLLSLFSWAPSSSLIAPNQEAITEFENSFHSSLPVLQILNTTEPIPPHNVTEVFSVVRYKSTIIDTASIFVMKYITNESSGSGNFILSYPLSLNDVASICKYPFRSSLSGNRTLYEVAIPQQVASALMAFEVCNISYGDTVTERELLPYTISRMVRPFRANLVRKRDSILYRNGRPLCESMLYALLNRNEVAARWFWEELMRLTKMSRQYAKAYYGMSSYVEDHPIEGYFFGEKPVNSWGPEHSWLRFWIIDRVNPYKKFSISSLVNFDKSLEKEFSSFMRSSDGWLAGRGAADEDDLKTPNKKRWVPKQKQECIGINEDTIFPKLEPYVHNIFTQASLYVDDDSSTCGSEYFEVDQQPAEKSNSVLTSAEQKDSEDRSDTPEVIDGKYSFWSYRARSARRGSVH